MEELFNNLPDGNSKKCCCILQWFTGSQTKNACIGDYAKDGGPGRSDFCVVFTMSLCALELKQTLRSLLF